MTYFDFRPTRGRRGTEVYVDDTLLGTVVVKADWRSRLTVSPTTDSYRALTPDGEPIPGDFRSRHDAAEALYELAFGATATG